MNPQSHEAWTTASANKEPEQTRLAQTNESAASEEEMMAVDDDEPEFSSKPLDDCCVQLKHNTRFDAVYEKVKEIWRGKYGYVFECRHRVKKSIWAVRVQRVLSLQKRSEILKEIEILNVVRHHPSIIQLRDAFEEARTIMLVTEFMHGGELLERICDERYELNELDCMVYVRQICDALCHMHMNNVVLLDLKPAHIQCLDNCTKRIKISDFTLSKFYKAGGEPLRVMQGTPQYMAPEIVSYDDVDFNTDMWTLGVITYIMLSGVNPFRGHNDQATLAKLTLSKYEFDDAFEMHSLEARSFISSLLVKRKEKRMTSAQSLTHPWLGPHAEGFGLARINTAKLREFVAAHRKRWNLTAQNYVTMKREIPPFKPAGDSLPEDME